MANKTADQCIEYILKNIDKRKEVDYGSRISVRRFNAAYDRILENARYIDHHHPNALGSLMELIYHQDIFVVEHCAPIILALDHSTLAQKWEAIGVIRALTVDERLSSGDRLGFSMSLEDWEAKLKKQTEEGTCGRIW